VSDSRSIKAFFQQETKRKKGSSNLPLHTLKHLLKEGKELELIGDKKSCGVSVINPIKFLHKHGTIGKKEYYATLSYQLAYEKSLKTNHARPRYDDQGKGGRGKVSHEPSQDQLTSSNKVVMVHEHFRPKFKEISNLKNKNLSLRLSYLKVLKEVVEKENSLRAFEREHNVPRNISSAVLKEICEELAKLDKKKS